MIITQHLATVAAKAGSQPAFVFLGKPTPWSEFKTRVGRLSYLYLRELGHGPRVAFIARECPAYAATFAALSNIRAVSIPMDPDRPPEELVAQLKEVKATHVAVTNDLTSRVRDWLQNDRLSLPLIEIERKQGGEFDPVYSPPPDHMPLDTDPVLLLPSSASVSARPRWAVLNHKQVIAAATSPRVLYSLKAGDRFLSLGGWNNAYSFVHGLLVPLFNGATCVINHGLENKELLELIAQNQVNRIIGTPPSLVHLLIVCKNEKLPLAGIRSVTAGLGPLSADIRKIFGLLNIPVLGCYGQVEAGWTIAIEGRGLPGHKYKVLDPLGDEISGSDTREGLLAVTGPSIMGGYYGLEADTQTSLRGTWLHTGDYARLEGAGDELRIHFMARKQDVIAPSTDSAAGKPILCEAIDSFARGIPGVQDGAGFPMDKTGGKVQLACAIVKVTGSTLSEKAVLEYCQARMPSHQVPQAVFFTDHIARSSGGVVHRAKLRRQFSTV